VDLSNKYEFGVREKVNGVVGTAMKASFTDMPNDTHNAETSNLAFDIRNIMSECRCSVFVGVFLGDEQRRGMCFSVPPAEPPGSHVHRRHHEY